MKNGFMAFLEHYNYRKMVLCNFMVIFSQLQLAFLNRMCDMMNVYAVS